MLATAERRQIITEDAFRVAPELLGRRLAPPWRRLAAIAVDLICVFLLTYTTSLGLAFAVFFACFWVSVRKAQGCRAQILRGLAGFAIGFFAFLGVLTLLEGGKYTVPISSWARFGAGIASMDPDLQQEAGALLEAEAWKLQEAQLQEWSEHASRLGGSKADSAESFRVDPEEERSHLERYLLALENGEETAGEDILTLRSRASRALAGRELALLEQQVEHERSERLQQTLENHELRLQLEDPSLVRSARAIASDLGLGLGWVAIYFIVFPALFRGQTPGKRLLGLQVVRLDGQVISAWNAFGRFGGYAAGIVTGLLGFLQIVWDDNRQAVHDKIVGTAVVLREKRPKRNP